MNEEKYTIEELGKMVDTHTILPDGSVVRKDNMSLVLGTPKIKKYKKEIKRKSKNCICMDCGAIIKTKEQSKHLKECYKTANDYIAEAEGKKY